VRTGLECAGKQGHLLAAGISAQSAGARKIHLQIATLPPGAIAKAHKHADHETAIYVLSGKSGMWFGEKLEQHLVVHAGDFLYIPANMAGKKIVGRKRHIAVDTDGRLLMVNLTTADIADSAGAQLILHAIRQRWPFIKHLFADGAYDRTKLMEKAELENFVIEIVRRIEGEPGFTVLPRRWVWWNALSHG
jgi:uncharacterized RmlC-like cupin family protein